MCSVHEHVCQLHAHEEPLALLSTRVTVAHMLHRTKRTGRAAQFLPRLPHTPHMARYTVHTVCTDTQRKGLPQHHVCAWPQFCS